MTGGGRRRDVVTRVYGSLLHLYPRAFRDEYGADMAQLLEDQRRDESSSRVLVRALVDLAVTVPGQHLEVVMHRSPAAVVSTVYLAIAAAGLALVVIGGSSGTTAVIGLVVAVGAGAIGIAGRRGAAPPPRGTVTARWWKFLLAGPVLVGAVILAAGVGVDAWYLGMVTVLAALVLSATGVVLGVAHLLTRRPRLIAD